MEEKERLFMNDDNKKMEKIIRIKIKIVLKIIEIIKGIKIILINFVPMKMKSQYKVEINENKKY